MFKSRLHLVAMCFGLSLLAALYLVPTTPGEPSGADNGNPFAIRDASAAPAKETPATGRFNYGAAFATELRKVGQISPKQFAERYPAPKYHAKLSFDPTTAKFFDKVNVEKVKKPGEKRVINGKDYQFPDVELPGYKLTDAELVKFKQNGFVVSERLGGYTFGQLYYDIYTRDLPVFITTDSVLHAWHRS